MKYRTEKDPMGEMTVPEDAYYGSQTERARRNFIDSGLKLPPIFLRALAMVKKHAAGVNGELGLLDPERSEAIRQAAAEVVNGNFENQFVVDLFQTGSATSTNMNMNEVIAKRAAELTAGSDGERVAIHPNDHVNLGQSSNDAVPTAIHVAALVSITADLDPALGDLEESLAEKSNGFRNISKIGRTHLQDAVPIRMGDVFGGYARQIHLARKRVKAASNGIHELPLGGTAVGNGLNTHPEFARRVIERIASDTGIRFREAENHFEAQAARDAAVEISGSLKTVAVSLTKIANDIRWLSSGPRCGLGELSIPSLQPGSSIMPGKVNPVISESMIQIGAQVVANDHAVTLGGMGGNFELNTMMPLIAYNLLQSISLLAAGAVNFKANCIDGLTPRRKNSAACLENSLALATYLVPALGYDRAAALAYKASAEDKSIRQVVLEESALPEEALDKLFIF